MAESNGGGFHSRSDSPSSTPFNLSCEQLELDLEDLDDTEYDLPPVENPPTLESILNEPDDAESGSDEETGTTTSTLFQDTFTDTASVASVSSTDSKGRRDTRRMRKSPQPYHGSILRHVVLKGVSVQIVSAADRVNAGMPTAMAAGTLIAIGTAHGIILVFDSKQILKWCLGTAATGGQYGSVSSLSFNYDCTRLLCGFAKGAITMWDLTTGKLLRTILDAHPMGTAVLHIKFTDDPTLAVCSDSGGSVFELNFRRVLGVRSCESRCLFSGSRGEVCTIQPLQSVNMKGHPLQDICLVAMATMSKVIVVSIRPKLKVVFTYGLKAKPSALPLVSWQYVIIQIEPDVKIIDPVFAFGREDVLYFFQVSMKEKSKNVSFIMLKKMELNYNLLNFSWLNPRTIVILDTSEQLRLVDVRTQETIEIIDLSDVQLVYASSHFKGLSTGGNVSKAMACAADQACYQSIISFNGQILLLGVKSVHLLTLRTWKERLDHLAKQHKYVEALELAHAFFEDRAKVAVGLKGKREEKMITVAKEMCNLLHSHMAYAVSKGNIDSSRPDSLKEYYQEVIPTSIDYHLLLEHSFRELEAYGINRPANLPNFLDLLFNKIYESFRSHTVTREIFLEALEPHILMNRFESISIPPSVVSDFVDLYASREAFEALQACVTHMEISTMDLHQVLTLCWAHSLHDAIFHIHNKAMKDYTGPLQEFLALLNESLKTGKQLTDNQITLGNKILVYISCCLAGRAYPIGDIDPNDVYSVKEQIFKCLISKHLPNRKPDDKLYPNLRILLHFDTREFLNVLSLAFEESEFDQLHGVWCRQDVIDVLIQIMHHSQEFSPTQVGSLFTFLARQMAKHETTIVVNRSLFEQVVEYLTNTSDESRHEERQQALLELHATGGLKFYDEERLLHQAEKAQFFQVCEVLYTKRREFNCLLGCYLQDPTRKMQVFSFTRNLMDCDDLSEAEHNTIQLEVIKNIDELLEIDNKQTAQLLHDCFPNSIPDIIDSMQKEPKTMYHFLHGLFEYQDSLETKTKHTSLEMFIDHQLAEKLIDLMCQFEPKNVYQFLRNREDYRLEETLEVTSKYKVMDASAYLLEKLGRIVEAFRILIETFDRCIADLMTNLMDGIDLNQSPTNLIWVNVESNLVILIQFCQRNSSRMAEHEREAVWFQLLDALMTPQRKLTSQLVPKYYETSKETIRHLLNSMMGYIKLPSILQKVIQDPSYNIKNFSEIRDLLLGLLDTYNYEKTLLETTSNLLNDDLHIQLQQLCKAANRGFAVHENICNSCNQSYSKSGNSDLDSVVLFRCGHGCHASCLHTIETLSAGSQASEQFACPLCQRCNKKEEMRKRRISVREVSNNTETAGPSGGKRDQAHTKAQVHLEPQQILALDQLRKLYQTSTRAAMLKMLSKKDTKPYSHKSSILHDVNFALKLAPPPIKSIK